MSENIYSIVARSSNIPNPFKRGDKVVAVHTDLTSLQPGNVYEVASSDPHNITLADGFGGYAHTRFVSAENYDTVEEDTTVDMNEFMRERAVELQSAIDAGTMSGYYSALGFIVTLMTDLASLTKE